MIFFGVFGKGYYEDNIRYVSLKSEVIPFLAIGAPPCLL